MNPREQPKHTPSPAESQATREAMALGLIAGTGKRYRWLGPGTEAEWVAARAAEIERTGEAMRPAGVLRAEARARREVRPERVSFWDRVRKLVE